MKRANNKLVKLLKKKELTLALAESVTCGLMSHQLSNVIGTSDVFIGSIVCYSEKVKRNVCKVPCSLLEKYTAESQEVTDALAENLSSIFNADIYMAVTGLAAPGGSERPGKPVGTVFITVSYKDQLHRLEKRFRGTPLEIRKKTCKKAYSFLYKIIRKEGD